jgi:hypothetical protein
VSTGIVLILTGAAGLIGPDWSGLLSGFPVVTFPLLMIIHLRHGDEAVATIARNYPYGLVSLVIFTLTVSYAYPHMGMNAGTLLGFLTATIYLAGLSIIIWKTPEKKAMDDHESP